MTDQPGVSRRRLLGVVGSAGAAGVAVGGAAGALTTSALEVKATPTTPLGSVGSSAVPFNGVHQAGITTSAQAVGHLVAFDLVAGADKSASAALLRRWSTAAEAMMAGRAPEGDDQIALDAGPCSLTVTFGFGASLFPKLGLASRVPQALVPIPAFTSDALDPALSGGDLWVQIGADDPLVAVHALRILRKQAVGTAQLRWQVNGFNRAPGATSRPMTVRNLMGQIDGTNNPKLADADFAQKIFVPEASGPEAWMNGGSYAVVRRIRMLLDPWDELTVAEQEQVIGRRKANGSPLSAPATTGTETTPANFLAFNKDGSLAIPGDAHIRVATAQNNGGMSILRRGFSYHDGYEADGSPNAGLLFVCWQADASTGFIPLQVKLDGADHLTRFIRHESSAIFAVPGGAGHGEYVGQGLFEA